MTRNYERIGEPLTLPRSLAPAWPLWAIVVLFAAYLGLMIFGMLEVGSGVRDLSVKADELLDILRDLGFNSS